MLLSTELLIAWRYISSRRKEKAISAIAAFSLAGIALGVAALIIVTSVMNGFRKEFTERIIGFNGHITIHTSEQQFNYEAAAEEMLAIDGVKQAIPVIEKQLLIMANGVVKATLCQGISPANLSKKDIISRNIEAGNTKNFSDTQEDSIILGESLADRLHLKIGDDVVIMAPELDETGFGFVHRKKTFKLAATFKSGMYEYDSSVSIIPLAMSQKLFKMPGGVTSISIFVNNPLELSRVRNAVHAGSQFYADGITDWQNSNSSFMKAVEVERNVMFLILTLITFVASFNIIACMIMLVKDKEKDIAILKTIGLAGSSIMRIFFVVGATIGVWGTAIGTGIGLLFSIYIKQIQAMVEGLLCTKIFSPEVYFLTHLPSILNPVDVLLIVAISLLLSCFATLYPARKASRLNPTEILRYA
ncbi:MAG: lipoprotein-releasing ABC transporter permease subunit [Holosporaceae bacterium]|nr:lipoprotein-releasing ABC transporter permease subunit [Holosporaceae bacterium]